jgi:hypothetical protein
MRCHTLTRHFNSSEVTYVSFITLVRSIVFIMGFITLHVSGVWGESWSAVRLTALESIASHEIVYIYDPGFPNVTKALANW